MRFQTNAIRFNPYLAYLTKDERNSDWFWALIRRWLYLWFASSLIIQSSILTTIPNWFLEVTAIGLTMIIPLLIVLLTLFVFTGAQVTFTEVRKELFTLLRLTNISHDAIFWCLILAVIYKARQWLTWLIGGFPLFIWLICFWYMRLSPGDGLTCFVSLLGHTYCYSDGPTYPSRLLEIFWFLSITISLLGITALITICSVGFTLKSRNAVNSALCVLILAMPFVMVVMLVVAPEGFLLIETEYQWNLIVGRIVFMGVMTATLPFIISLGAQHFLQRWTLD